MLLACLGLAACGGSSSSSTDHERTATAASATAPAPRAPAPEPRAGRFKALRECLQKNGITLPQRSSRHPAPRAGGFLGGGAGTPPLPNGVTRAQYEAAVKKCGGGAFGGGGGRIRSPAFKQALAKFATCMRENGVNVPPPNTSGKGPVFNTKGLNPTSAQFKAAEAKCRTTWKAPLRAGRALAGRRRARRTDRALPDSGG